MKIIRGKNFTGVKISELIGTPESELRKEFPNLYPEKTTAPEQVNDPIPPTQPQPCRPSMLFYDHVRKTLRNLKPPDSIPEGSYFL